MKKTLALAAIVAILFSPAEVLAVSEHIEYDITVNKDGSASWIIIRATEIDSAIDNCEEFEQKILSAINTARDRTGRDMRLDMTSLQMKMDIHWEASSQTIQYLFRWQNFSVTEENQIIFGDVFYPGFFSALCGDGELYVTYPTEYSWNSASPTSNVHTSAPQTMHWYRTQDFLIERPDIALTKQDSVMSQGISLTIIVALCAVALGTITMGFLIFNSRRKRRERLSRTAEPSKWHGVEGSKEEILQLIRSSGGGIRQSEICAKLKFSRAKTSILLAEMEKNNQVRREKNGKNKMVYVLK